MSIYCEGPLRCLFPSTWTMARHFILQAGGEVRGFPPCRFVTDQTKVGCRSSHRQGATQYRQSEASVTTETIFLLRRGPQRRKPPDSAALEHHTQGDSAAPPDLVARRAKRPRGPEVSVFSVSFPPPAGRGRTVRRCVTRCRNFRLPSRTTTGEASAG